MVREVDAEGLPVSSAQDLSSLCVYLETELQTEGLERWLDPGSRHDEVLISLIPRWLSWCVRCCEMKNQGKSAVRSQSGAHEESDARTVGGGLAGPGFSRGVPVRTRMTVAS